MPVSSTPEKADTRKPHVSRRSVQRPTVARARGAASPILTTLKQTPEVVAVQEAVVSWPLASVGAFLNQSRSDEDMTAASRAMIASKDAAIAVVALMNSDSEDAERLRALDVVLTDASDGGQSLLQVFTDALFALGVAYGVRLAGDSR